MNGVYGAATVTANNVQFWLCRFRSGIFDVEENFDKIAEITEVDRHISSRSNAHELKIDHT